MSKPRIVFLNPPFPAHRAFVDFPFFANLGMLQAAAVCRAAGLDVRVADAFSQPDSGAFEIDAAHFMFGCGADRFIEITAGLAPDIIVVCGNPHFNLHARTPWLSLLLERLHRRRPGGALVYADCHAGGAYYADVPADTIRLKHPRIRHIVKYNAESQLPTLLQKLIENPQMPPETLCGGLDGVDFTTLPPPAWDLIAVDSYRKFLETAAPATGRALAFKPGARTLPAAFSRGSTRECIHKTCNPGDTRPVYKRLSETQTRALLESYRALGCDRIVFLDDLPNPSAEVFDAALALLDEYEFDYDFACGVRSESLTRAQVARMKPRITRLRADAPPDDNRKTPKFLEHTAAWCKELDMPFEADFVIGLPGESMETVNGTLRRAAQLRRGYNARPRVMFAVPLPGSKLREVFIARGVNVNDNVAEFSSCYTESGPLAAPPETAAALKKAFDNFHRIDFSDRIERVSINVTYKCNNKCAFCPVGDREQIHGEPADVMRALETYRARGVSEVWFKGGEPAIHPQIFKILSAARDAGYERIGLATNARMAAFPTFTEKLLAAGLTGVEVSLFGATAKTHDEHTRAPGSFEQTLAGIRNIMEMRANAANVSIAATLTATNIKELPKIAALISKAGVSKLIVQPVLPLGKAEKHHVPNPAAVTDIIKNTIQKAPASLEIHMRHIPPCLLPGLENHLDDDLHLKTSHIVLFGYAGISLSEYIRHTREKKDVCRPCPYDIICDGFYVFKEETAI